MCIQLACSRRPRAFEEAHRRNIQAKIYNEKFPIVYESDNIWDSLYEEHGATLKHNIWDSLYEEHGATLKHNCGKRIVALPLFFLFVFLLGLPFFYLAFLFFWDNALWMMIITLLFTYKSKLQIDTRTKYDSIWMPLAV